MAQFPTNPQSVPPTEEQVMTVKEYIKAVKSGRIPKGPNHSAIEELATKPHAQQTQVIVLSYEHPKQKTQPETQTTQIYLKTKEMATYSSWVKDDEEAEQVIYNFRTDNSSANSKTHAKAD